MFCEKCGKQLNDDAAFCPYCGHTVNIPTSTPDISTTVGPKENAVSRSADNNYTKSATLAIGFIILAIAEYVAWVILSSKNGYGYFDIFKHVMHRLCRNLLLFGPVVNLVFAVFFFTRKAILLRISVLYGLLSSFAIACAQISKYIYMDNTHKGLPYASLGGITDVLTRIVIIGTVSVLVFTILLLLSRKPSKIFAIVLGITTAIRNLALVVLFTAFLPQFSTLDFELAFSCGLVFKI